MDNQSGSGIQLPTWEEMKGRLFLVGLVILCFTLLGLWLNTNGWLAGFSTMLVVSVGTFLHARLRGKPTNKPGRERAVRPEAGQLIDTVREHRVLRPLTTSLAGQVLRALAIGLGVAIAELLVQLWLFPGDDSWHTRVLSLSLVLFPLLAITGICESRAHYVMTNGWLMRLRLDFAAWVRASLNIDFGKVTPALGAVLWAAVRTLISALSRSFMMLVLEPIFNNWYAIGCIIVFGLIMVVGGLRVVAQVGRHVADVALPDQQRTPADDDRPTQSE